MRIAAVAAASVLLGCGGPSGGTVTLVLDIPNAALDPTGFTNVEVRLHQESGDSVMNVAVADSAFDLGTIEVTRGVLIEAVLRTDSGVAVGYGRAAAPSDLTAGAEVIVPVRRPIIYFAGLVSADRDMDANTENDLEWGTAAATYSDLSTGTSLDGSTVLAGKAVLMVAAGPNLFMIDQQPDIDSGVLTGTPTIKRVSTGDHSIEGTLPAMLSGAVRDAAGSDDGRLLLVGTSTKLFLVDTETGMAKPVADGDFEHLAVVSAGGGTMTAVAIKRISTTGACPERELVWLGVGPDDVNQVVTLGTGGFADVAGDRGRAFYVDECTGELGEATATGITMMRGGLGKATALAVSGTQAWIGIEKPGTPAQLSLVSATLSGSDTPRTLFSEPSVQVVEAFEYPGVQRLLSAKSAVFNQLEIGAGGDYVAATLASQYAAARVPNANFPKMEIESQELRVLDAATGAAVQRYRSWCDGRLTLVSALEIQYWACATSPGQTAPSDPRNNHRIGSMTFQFGKK
jgi:hypothetical protein